MVQLEAVILPAGPSRLPATALFLICVFISTGCRRPEPAVRSGPVEDLAFLQPRAVGAPIDGQPWITHVNVADLDGDGHLDILACDALKNSVVWLRSNAAGAFDERILADRIPAPAHVEPVDFDGDGDLDLLIASMGQILPNNDHIGAVLVLENDGRQQFTRRVILDRVARVTDVRAGDFNRDGKLDLAVAQFGYFQGEVGWLENHGNWAFTRHILLSQPGAINVCVADMNADGADDIVTVVSQDSEEIHLFSNDGRGRFATKVIFGSTNPDFGSSGLSLCDLNRDGRPDVLYTNGDGFDLAAPGARPWHGVQWLENLGENNFRYHRIGDLAGAYSPVGVDLDGDGARDVVAVSGFNDWKNPQAISLVVFRNDGKLNFTPRVLAHTPTHLVTVAAADLDGHGQPTLVTGGFHAYPPHDRMSRLAVWQRPPPR